MCMDVFHLLFSDKNPRPHRILAANYLLQSRKPHTPKESQKCQKEQSANSVIWRWFATWLVNKRLPALGSSSLLDWALLLYFIYDNRSTIHHKCKPGASSCARSSSVEVGSAYWRKRIKKIKVLCYASFSFPLQITCIFTKNIVRLVIDGRRDTDLKSEAKHTAPVAISRPQLNSEQTMHCFQDKITHVIVSWQELGSTRYHVHERWPHPLW